MDQQKTVLRHIRRGRDLTLADVEANTGVPLSTLSRIERGVSRPTTVQANALAGYFGRSIDELLSPAPEAA